MLLLSLFFYCQIKVPVFAKLKLTRVLFSVELLEPKTKKNHITLPKLDIFDVHNFDLDINVDENQVRQNCFKDPYRWVQMFLYRCHFGYRYRYGAVPYPVA